jgi:branched-chain amino acid transport system permease protein
MIILGGLGSIWGVAFGAVLLQLVNRYLIPDVLNDKAQSWFNFDLTQLSFSIFGFILVLVMLIRPEGLLPERRRKAELREGIGATEESLVEVRV